MNILKTVLGLCFFLTFYSCMTNEKKTDNKFHGMWRLDKYESFDSTANTWRQDTTRIDDSGYIIYDGKGHMGVHLTPKGYKDFNTEKNIDSLNSDDLKELLKFYRSNFVYIANVEVTDSTVSHKRLSATEPINWGTTLIRDFDFRQDTLILTAHETITGQRLRLRWINMN